ncbi:MAG: hypothetical protein AAFR65_03855 [Pseudomonadota bacterium]
MRTVISTLVAITAMGTGHAAQINLLVNPSFELDVIEDSSGNPVTANQQPAIGWTSINRDPLLIDGAYLVEFPSAAADGDQYANLGNSFSGQPTPGLSQTVVVPEGGQITAIGADFNLPALSTFGTRSSFRIELYDEDGVRLNPNTASFTITVFPPNSVWQSFNITLPGILGPGMYTVVFASTGTGPVDLLIDNARVLADVPDNIIPVPGAMLLFVPALLMLRRRSV